jgi:protein-S-isoprenylcysteine O-methyltransferase Ste14
MKADAFRGQVVIVTGASAGIGRSLALLLWRIPREEQMMLEAFGDEYKTYMEYTGRFLPKLGTTKAEKGTSHA